MNFKSIAFLFVLIPAFFFAQDKLPYQESVDSLFALGQDKQVIPFFERKIIENPKNSIAYLWLSKIHQEMLEFDQSTSYSRKALQLDPNCHRCYLILAQNTANQGKVELALSQLDSLFRIKPDYAKAFVIRGLIKEQMGQDAGVILDLNKAISLDPKDPEIYFARGNYYLRKNYSSSALSDYNKAIASDPDFAPAYYERAKLYFEKEELSNSLNDMNLAIKADSSFSDYYLGRATVYSALKEHRLAVSDLLQAIHLDSLNYYGYFYLSQAYYELEDMDRSCINLYKAKSLLGEVEGEEQLKRTIALSLESHCDESKASYYYQRGVANYNKTEFANAVEIYSKGLEKFPSNSMILSFRGNAFFMLGKHEQALKDYQSALENLESVKAEIKANEARLLEQGISFETYYVGYQAGIYLQLAETKLALNQVQQALTDINQAIHLLPNVSNFGAEAYYNVRGNIYLFNGLYSEALADFEKSIKLNPSFALGYVNRAISLMNLSNKPNFKNITLQAGMSKENFQVNWQFPLKAKAELNALSKAMIDCNKALELDPSLAYAYYVRGHIKRLQQNVEACTDFKKARELGYPVEDELLKNCR